tara:strand:+ start:312 stop:587 length:276 start_codon:yes stop_codon:yes gene_type:complete
MIEKEETILRKFLSNDQVIVLMQNDILHLLAMAMRAYKNEATLVKKLTLTDVSQQRELLKAYEMFVNKDAYNKLEDPINKIIEKFLAFNCG